MVNGAIVFERSRADAVGRVVALLALAVLSVRSGL